ncbi:hypothetical protein [Rhodoferax mekongensis]|uniref:TonB C-terminal domain-containing protein n=1 Tax=Rhodoferax mekongensis TaxID=3068341 RepID=A0ABZ0AUU9_9BURK|nr:hypothetical protein [Rhodoferax sp. TBRC 17307]WNO03420.1 hypothetical protein RAN89_10825 [Rhodoferax sp. TBRC 17307]
MLAVTSVIALMRYYKAIGVCLLASAWLHLVILLTPLYSFFGASKAQTGIQRTTIRFLTQSTTTIPEFKNFGLFEGSPSVYSENIQIQTPSSRNLLPRIGDEYELHFFSLIEVDTPATPVGEWVIDWTSWPSSESQTISFTLWIDEKGKIVEWKLLGTTSNLSQIEKAMAVIIETPMNPAFLNGLPVPSVQTIELGFVPD